MKNPQNIAITGASGGLGAALARRYAQPGVTLHLHGRNEARLAAAAEACRKSGAVVHTHAGDVREAETMAGWLAAADEAAPLDLVIANAGISAGTGSGLPARSRSVFLSKNVGSENGFASAEAGGESSAQAREIFAVNMDGILNTITPVLPRMIARRRGQVALMSSLAGHRGLPSSPAYSASKGWARLYAEGLRGWLGKEGVEVSAICPGYIKTPMTDINDFPMPGILDADKAAAIIARGLAKNKARIAFPLWLHSLSWILGCLPPALTDPLFSRLPPKSPLP